jgi:hypothetical protein
MRTRRAAALALASAAAWGAVATATPAGAAEGDVFAAYVDEAQEVPRTGSEAWCWMIFEVGSDSIEWGARCFDIENVVAGHLHLAPRGVNGPIVVPLLPMGSHSGAVVDFEGTITDDTLTGPLEGMTVDDLVAAIEDGDVYANFHSDDGVAPQNTGPGDIATGEVRGQLVDWS